MYPGEAIDQSRSNPLAATPVWVQQMNSLGADNIPFLFILDFKMSFPVVIPLDELPSTDIRYQIKNVPEYPASNTEISFQKTPVDFQEYEIGFQKALRGILAGDTYLLNLTYPTRLHGVSNLEEIFLSAKAPYKLYFKKRFVCFSPECFVTIEDGVIRTFPMKGTIDASLPDASQRLLDDLKEKEEHATVVDLLRNDLSMVATQVTVERYRYLEEITTNGKTLIQCSSEISGQLTENYHQHLGDIFHALLPAGSVTGAPKKRTVEIIEEIEKIPRDYYTGVFGVFDGKKLDSGVMIRMIEQRGDEFYYRSGGGITYRSDVRQEYEEMVDKVYVPR